MITYSQTLILYNIFLNYFVPYVAANAVRLGVSPSQVLILEGYLAQWIIDFEAYINPGTYGPITIGNINARYNIYHPYSDAIKKQIKNQAGLVLTTTDYRFTQIHEDKSHSTVPVPTEECAVSLDGTHHLNNSFHVYDVANPTHSGKPKDVARIGRYLYVQAANLPDATYSQLLRISDSTTADFDIPFDALQVGMKGFLATTYMNEKGEEGTISAIFPFSII